jgi:hypothetical protein
MHPYVRLMKAQTDEARAQCRVIALDEESPIWNGKTALTVGR